MGKIFIDHGIIYEEYANGLVVKGFENQNDKRLKLVIPASLEMENHPNLRPSHTLVTRIHTRAFINATNLQSIEIPETIGVIEEYAFNGCQNVKTVSSYGRRGENMLVIEKGAFQFCCQLEKVAINRPRIFISNDAFRTCSNLQVFTGKVSGLHRNAFDGCNLEILAFVDNATIRANSIEKSGVKKLFFYGESFTIAPKIWTWIKKSDIQICCSPNSNLVNLVYEGVTVEVLQ